MTNNLSSNIQYPRSNIQNLIEKIVQRYAVGLAEGHVVRVGDYISIKPAHILTHDNTGAVMNKFKGIGATRIFNPRQPMFALDHNVQDTSEENMKKYKGIESFAAEMGVDFYPAGRGIGHQIMCEEGYVWPGTMVVASDSHANMYGGLGALGTPIVRSDAAAIWATGRTWWQVPPVVKIILNGKLPEGVTGKDLIITLCGFFNNDEVLNHVLEFTGDGVATLSIDHRLSIANMTTEWGALAGVFQTDATTINWLKSRAAFIKERGLAGVPSDADGNGIHPRINEKRIAELENNPLTADADASYAGEIHVDLSTVSPHIAGPDNLKTMKSLDSLKANQIKIQKAYLVSCVNSRVEDLAEAAQVIRGKHVADGVEFYVAAASSEVEAESRKRGDWDILVKAGAKTLLPGCGPCIGLGTGLLEDGEIGISATNRNFKGRMGSKSAQAYLGSPAVVAASAVAGYITSTTPGSSKSFKAEFIRTQSKSGDTPAVPISEGFPESITGEIIFCHQDNLNTDGIYPGKYTYLDDFTNEQQAEVVMENYDQKFGKIVKDGDILAGGYNFGSGSSREQAATALKYRGIKLVIAGSFSQTYKRNAINNGFLVMNMPELLEDLKKSFGTEKLSIRTGWKATIDFTTSTLVINNKTYSFDPVGTAAQELIIAGGLEPWVKQLNK